MKRVSSTSVRQSLGMPSRDVALERYDPGEGKVKRKSKPPMGGGRPSTAAAGSQRRKTTTKAAPSTQFGRRATQSGAMGGSRASTGR